MCSIDKAKSAGLFSVAEAKEILGFVNIKDKSFVDRLKKDGIEPTFSKRGKCGGVMYSYNDLEIYNEVYHRCANLSSKFILDRIAEYRNSADITVEYTKTGGKVEVKKVEVKNVEPSWTLKAERVSKILGIPNLIEVALEEYYSKHKSEIRRKTESLREIVQFVDSL